MGKKQKMLSALADTMDLPAEALPGQTVAELWGSERAVIENHRGILAFSREEILIKVTYGAIRICGRDMEIQSMTGEQVLIAGSIESIAPLEGKTV